MISKFFKILILLTPIFIFSCSDSGNDEMKILIDGMIKGNDTWSGGLSKEDAECSAKEAKKNFPAKLWKKLVKSYKPEAKELSMGEGLELGVILQTGYDKCGVTP